MKTTKFQAVIMVGLLGLVMAMNPVSECEATTPEVAGVLGLQPVIETSCVAAWMPIPEGMALAGVTWYNNDGNIVYPQVLLESGTPDNPVTLDEFRVVAENVQGGSSTWSSVTFDAPVACASEGLYVVFRFPVGSLFEFEGAGGGAAIGYTVGDEGCAGWLSSTGDTWLKIDDGFGLAVMPMLVDESEAVATLQSFEPVIATPEAPSFVTRLQPAAPNPFNPETELRFSLREAGPVDLAIYNVRGQRVVQLVQGPLPMGDHSITWRGKDENGVPVASGVYFARFTAGQVTMTQRLVLVE